MATRSGKRYLPPYKCATCQTFWGHEIYDFKCSHCATNGMNPIPPPSIESRIEQLDQWVSTRKIIDPNYADGKKILRNCKKMCNMRLFILIQTFKSKGYFPLTYCSSFCRLSSFNISSFLIVSALVIFDVIPLHPKNLLRLLLV